MTPVATIEVREGTFTGELPYLVVGSGEPLVYLCGFTLDHRNPRQGFERTLTLRTLTPLARAGFQVYFTNRWPDMAPGTACRGDSRSFRQTDRRAGCEYGRITGASADCRQTGRGAQGGGCLCCVRARSTRQGGATEAFACN